MVFPVVLYECENLSKRRLSAKDLMVSNYAGEHSWESLYSKESKSVSPKGNQPWLFIGMTDAEAPMLWPPDAKRLLIGKGPDVGKDGGQEEKGWQRMGWLDCISNSVELSLRKVCTLQEIVKDRKEAWHAAVHGVAELDMTEWLNLTERTLFILYVVVYIC